MKLQCQKVLRVPLALSKRVVAIACLIGRLIGSSRQLCRIDLPFDMFVPSNRTTIPLTYTPYQHSINRTPSRQRQLIPQVGMIQRQIGQVDEAVSSFNDALTLDPESILALEGSGEAYLAQAHARTSEGLYNAAAKALRNGRDATKRFLDLSKGKNIMYI